MVSGKITYTNGEGYAYRFPERSCKKCVKYPCLEEMFNYKSDFAKYGCKNYQDPNFFESIGDFSR